MSNAFKPYATFPVKTCTIEERAMKYHGVQYLLAPNDADFSRLDITDPWTGPGVEFTITVNPVFDSTVETPIDNVADWP